MLYSLYSKVDFLNPPPQQQKEQVVRALQRPYHPLKSKQRLESIELAFCSFNPLHRRAAERRYPVFSFGAAPA